jgi:uncharacterized protein DUF4153
MDEKNCANNGNEDIIENESNNKNVEELENLNKDRSENDLKKKIIEEKKTENTSSTSPPPGDLNFFDIINEEEKKKTPPPYQPQKRKIIPKPDDARLREYLGLMLSVIICDITIYRGGGFSGYSIFFISILPVLYFCSLKKKTNISLVLTSVLILISAVRLFYLGSPFLVVFGIFLLFSYVVAISGSRPFIIETIIDSCQICIHSFSNLAHYISQMRSNKKNGKIPKSVIIIPVICVMIFGTIFIMANPVLKDFTSKLANNFWKTIGDFIPSISHVIFWFFILCCSAALLRPRFSSAIHKLKENVDMEKLLYSPASLYSISRNVLISLILLFGLYFIFEFYYLWWRDIPDNFRYSEYAHQGAAWLTFALALSTLMLGCIFLGKLLIHKKINYLKKLTWIWSFENFILALCAFHRTKIYIVYNGLSRMRVMAILGIAVVVAGLILVVFKVAYSKNIVWLIRRQIIALFLTIFLYLVIPVDYLVTRYNVKQIMSGNSAPCVQIAVHRIGSDGCLQLLPLLKCGNPEIEEGVKALLADTHRKISSQFDNENWSYYQRSESNALKGLNKHNADFNKYSKNPEMRWEALNKFKSYGKQWYD